MQIQCIKKIKTKNYQQQEKKIYTNIRKQQKANVGKVNGTKKNLKTKYTDAIKYNK